MKLGILSCLIIYASARLHLSCFYDIAKRVQKEDEVASDAFGSIAAVQHNCAYVVDNEKFPQNMLLVFSTWNRSSQSRNK